MSTRRRLSLLLATLLGATSLSVGIPAAHANGNCVTYFAGLGTGTSDDPYLVDSQSDLAEVAFCLSSHFRQTGDIALSGTWTPLGNSGAGFTGVYDGGGNDILNLSINVSPPSYNVGLFAEVRGSITRMNVSGTVIGGDQTGGIVGYLNNGTITDSSSAVNVTGTFYTGGLVGLVTGTDNVTAVSNSSASGNITSPGSSGNVGGLIGGVQKGNVVDSWATGTVTASGSSAVGGLIGQLWGGDLTGSFASGNVSGAETVGGLAGRLESNTKVPTISQSYARGNVSAPSGLQWTVGGLVGLVLRGNVNFSYSTGTSAGVSRIGGFIGETDPSAYLGLSGVSIGDSYSSGNATGTEFTETFIGLERTGTLVADSGAKTSTELQNTSTFISWSISPYWDGGTTWAICSTYNDGYPYLVGTVSANPSGCALTPVPDPTPAPTPTPTPAPSPEPTPTVTPTPEPTPTATEQPTAPPVFQEEVRPLAPGIEAVTGEVIAVTVPVRSTKPAGKTAKGAPRVSGSTGDIIRVSINGLAPSSDVVVAIRINGRWMRLGTASTGVKGRTTLPAFETTVPGDYLMRIRGKGAGTRYVLVTVT